MRCSCGGEWFHLLCYRAPVSVLFHSDTSLISFIIAFLLLCFENSDIITLSFIGSLSGVIAVLIVWCIWRFWGKHPVSDAQPSEKLLSFEEDDWDERRKKFTFEVVVPEPLEEHQHSTVGFKFPPSFNWPSFLHRPRPSDNVEEP